MSSLKEELISFDTSKLAKEKGFNISTKFTFKSNGKKYEGTYFSGQPDIYYRPTQSLLQKWLREEHQLHITIYSCSQESWMSRITRPGQKLEHGMYGEDYDTYEDALEDALYMALKTIE